MRRMGILVLVWHKSIHFGVLTKLLAKNDDFYIFVPSDLGLCPLDVKFAPLVSLAHRYVSIKLEVSTAFVFRENRSHGGGTDRRKECNA